MDKDSNIHALFAARAVTADNKTAAGNIISLQPLSFAHLDQMLDLTLLHVRLNDAKGSTPLAFAVLPGKHSSLVGSSMKGDLFPDRASYDALLGHNDPHPSYIHAVLLHNKGLFFNPYTVEIEGYGHIAPPQTQAQMAFSWFSGLIGGQKGVKPSPTINFSP